MQNSKPVTLQTSQSATLLNSQPDISRNSQPEACKHSQPTTSQNSPPEDPMKSHQIAIPDDNSDSPLCGPSLPSLVPHYSSPRTETSYLPSRNRPKRQSSVSPLTEAGIDPKRTHIPHPGKDWTTVKHRPIKHPAIIPVTIGNRPTVDQMNSNMTPALNNSKEPRDKYSRSTRSKHK